MRETTRYTVVDTRTGKVVLEDVRAKAAYDYLNVTYATVYKAGMEERLVHRRYKIIITYDQTAGGGVPNRLWEQWRYLNKRYGTK